MLHSWLWRITGALIALHMIVLFGGRHNWGIPEPIGRLFFLDQEYNAPTFYTSVLFVLCAFYCARLGYHVFNRKRFSSLIWFFLGFLLLFFSADEWFSLHEKLIVPLRTLFGIEQGIFYFAWTIVYIGLLIFVLLLTKSWLRALQPQFRTRLVFAACIYVTGALVLEMTGSWVYSTGGNVYSHTYANIVTLEESLELIGLTLAATLLPRYRVRRLKVIPIEKPSPSARRKRKVV